MVIIKTVIKFPLMASAAVTAVGANKGPDEIDKVASTRPFTCKTG